VFFSRGVEFSLYLLFDLLGTEVTEFTVVTLFTLSCEIEFADVILKKVVTVYKFVFDLVLLMLSFGLFGVS